MKRIALVYFPGAGGAFLVFFHISIVDLHIHAFVDVLERHYHLIPDGL